MDRGAWRAAVRGVAKSPTRLSDFTLTFTLEMCLRLGSWEVAELKFNSGGLALKSALVAISYFLGLIFCFPVIDFLTFTETSPFPGAVPGFEAL